MVPVGRRVDPAHVLPPNALIKVTPSRRASPLPFISLSRPTKGCFQHVFGSVGLSKHSPGRRGPTEDVFRRALTAMKRRALHLKHTLAGVLTASTCVSPCLGGSERRATHKDPFDV